MRDYFHGKPRSFHPPIADSARSGTDRSAEHKKSAGCLFCQSAHRCLAQMPNAASTTMTPSASASSSDERAALIAHVLVLQRTIGGS